MILRVAPVAKPRQTRRDKWCRRPEVARYRAFADELRFVIGLRFPYGLEGAQTLILEGARVSFCLPMPKSWPKYRREEMNGAPHQQKPDIDNLLKALFDALLLEDCTVWRAYPMKFWGESGYIELLPLHS